MGRDELRTLGIEELRDLVLKQHGEIEKLRAENAELRRVLEEQRRAGKRQAARFSKGKPKSKPKRPGRKSGEEHGPSSWRKPPDETDEEVDATFDSTCPECGDTVIEESVEDQYQTEIPPVKPIRRRIRIHVGRCRGCGQRVRGRHPWQTSDATGAAGSQLGPNLLALAAIIRSTMGASFDKLRDLFSRVFGIEASRSGLARALSRTATKAEPTYDLLIEDARASPVVYADETGSRMSGRSWWLWVFTTKDTTVYVQRPSRGFDVIEEILGSSFDGIIGHDGWAPYDQLEDALHQQCITHLVHRASELGEARPGAPFPAAVKTLFQDALALRDRRDAQAISPHGLAVARGRLESRLDELLIRTVDHPDDQRFQRHLVNHYDDLFTFLWHPEVEAANWPAEQAIRPAVIFRKLSGGHRSPKGAKVHDILTSLTRTWAQRGADAITSFRDLLCRPVLGSASIIDPG